MYDEISTYLLSIFDTIPNGLQFAVMVLYTTVTVIAVIAPNTKNKWDDKFIPFARELSFLKVLFDKTVSTFKRNKK